MPTSFSEIICDVRSSDAFVILGAGASFQAGMPLAGHLAPLVWHAIDSSDDLLEETCRVLGVAPSAAKHVLQNDPIRLQHAFRLIAANTEGRRTFQSAVCDLNRNRCGDVSRVHDALSRLIFGGRIVGILSLNWDTLLEASFRRKYGFFPARQHFAMLKPHGDCTDPSSKWTLPHEPGALDQATAATVASFATARPRALLIVGYSERDKTIVDQVIDPISRSWRVYRIGPSAVGEGAIQCDAGEALDAIANALTPEPESAGWRSVPFGNQRGIEAAIAGERLGWRDVVSCPTLPHFDAARNMLMTLHSVEISGSSGCGKSITAWQLAHEYNTLGWHVVRPDVGTKLSDSERLAFIATTRWPTVAVIDDTQTYSPDFIASLQEHSRNNFKLICGTTDLNWEKRNAIRLSASAAVQILAENFRKRRHEVLSIVKRFDSHIGDDFMSVRLEDRIDSAAKSNTPWEFAYALRGGWRKTR
ncbi:MAG: hypothetical protein IT428_18305, partial [Planctomycetaceae bacterium]|nr:hypothetical protein [Planctomycetaceae bacterium]